MRTIYEEGIRGGDATFETETPSWERWDAAHPELRLVAERDGAVVGWAALSPASARRCYRGVGEVSVYVAEAARGAGLGRALLAELVERSEQAGYWTLTAGVFPENEASVRLHKSCGFREVGVREGIGEAGGVWRDVICWSAALRWSAREVPVRRLPVGARESRARARALPRRSHPGRVVSRRRRRPLRPLGPGRGAASAAVGGEASPPRRAARASARASTSSPTGTAAGRSGSGGCCATSATRTAPSCSAGSTSGEASCARARRRSSRPSSSRASGAATRSRRRRSRAVSPIRRSRSSTRAPPTAGAASRTRSTTRRAGSPAPPTHPGTSRCPELPDGELVAYCGSGVTACVTLHRAWLAGREGRLYPGSWSEWSQRGLPLERG